VTTATRSVLREPGNCWQMICPLSMARMMSRHEEVLIKFL
jgi:hypothetical protein